MAIDNPMDAFEQQCLKEEPNLPNQLAKYAFDVGKLALPDAGFAVEILMRVADTLFDKESGKERIRAFFTLVVDEFKHIEKTKVSHQDMQSAICKAVWYDRYEQDDRKRDRYIKFIGKAARIRDRSTM
jgi:hypothetical protein